MYKYFLALRYLLSRPIHAIGAIGITVAVWSLIVVYSIFSGYLVEMVGHVRGAVADLSFLFNDSKDSWALVEPVLRKTDGVRAAAPRIVWYALVAPEKKVERKPGELDPATTSGKLPTNFFQVVGLDTRLEQKLRDLESEFAAVEDPSLRVANPSEPFSPLGFGAEAAALPRLALGYARAESWQLRRGDIVTLASARPTAKGQAQVDELDMVHQRFVFAGAFQSKYFEFENTTALVSLDTMRRLFPIAGAKTQDAFSEIAIMIDDPEQGATMKKILDRKLADSGFAGRVAEWRDRGFAAFLDNVEHQRSLMTYVLSILMAVSAFLVFATLLMMVSEKTRDVGILQALGATRWGILTIFLVSGLTIALVGAAAGTSLGVVTCVNIDAINSWLEASLGLSLFPRNIYGLEKVPYSLDVIWIATVIAVALVVTILFSVIPAWLAARMDPVKALRR